MKSADGTEIYAEAVGDSSKSAVIFLHGFSMSSMAFDPIFNDPQWLANLYLVSSMSSYYISNKRLNSPEVRYDVRGHGRSAKPVDEASWESKRLAEDFDAVVEAFKLDRPFVLGW